MINKINIYWENEAFVEMLIGIIMSSVRQFMEDKISLKIEFVWFIVGRK